MTTTTTRRPRAVLRVVALTALLVTGALAGCVLRPKTAKEIQQMEDQDKVDDLIWIASSSNNLTQAPFNFVPAQEGRFRIAQPDGRGGYFMALDADGLPFEGTLEAAYEYVYQDRVETRRLYLGTSE